MVDTNPRTQYASNGSNTTSNPNQTIKTFVFGDLPPEEKIKFLEFLINNNVEFS